MGIFDDAGEVVRTRDRDRYVADLFAPAPVRKHLFALHAFDLEIARIPTMVSQPALGEIRLQWWRDALAAGDGSGNPVAAAVIETLRAFALPPAALDMLIEARTFDLYDDPMPTLDALEGYAGETASAALQLAAIVLAGGRDPGSADAAGHGGVGQTMVSLLQALASDPRAAKYVPDELLLKHGVGRSELMARKPSREVRAVLADLRAVARRHLDRAAAALATLPPATAPTFLPLAIADARLARLEQNAANPFGSPDLPAWRRLWIIWRSARQQRRAGRTS